MCFDGSPVEGDSRVSGYNTLHSLLNTDIILISVLTVLPSGHVSNHDDGVAVEKSAYLPLLLLVSPL
jgi:hypothetical protein